jgi:hypothetical protein
MVGEKDRRLVEECQRDQRKPNEDAVSALAHDPAKVWAF